MQTVGRVDLPGLLAAFHVEHPGIEIALREETTPALLAELAAGRIDIALGALMGDPLPRGVIAKPLFTEDLVALVARGHPLAGRQTVWLAELARERFVFSRPGSPIRRAATSAAAAIGDTIQVAFETSESALMRAIVARGLAVTVVPRSLAEEPGQPVAILHFEGWRQQRTVALLWVTERPHTAAAKRFLDVAREVMGDGLLAVGCWLLAVGY